MMDVRPPVASTYHFRARAELAVAPHWRPFDLALAHWVRCHGGSVLLARLAAELALAESRGDSALRLDQPAESGLAAVLPLEQRDLAALRAEPLVGSGDESDAVARPFVLDGTRLYFRRNFRHECAVAAHLAARLDTAIEGQDGAAAECWLEALFAGEDAQAVADQRAAVSAALRRGFLVLTGGPGTGKTTTLLKLLLLRLRAEPRLRVALCAPTGKAGRRIAESLRQGRERFQAGPIGADGGWHEALAAVAALTPLTVHRLLGARAGLEGFRHHAGEPLALDLVIVDEASMLDLGLLRALLEALPKTTQLVLVGDPDQLSPVDTGNVLADLVAVLEANGGHPSRVRLRHGFRAGRTLLAANEAVRLGDRAAFDDACAASGGAVRLHALDGEARLGALLRDWVDALQAALAAAGIAERRLDRAGRLGCFAALRGLQLLCALREGPYGAWAVDAAISARLAAALGWPGQPVYPGRAVIVTCNDPATGLLNGDVGLYLPDAQGRLSVHFEIDGPSGPDTRAFSSAQLPAHAGAFALTVHRSQGSEYERVAVLLPPEGGERLLTRQLLYTAMTRARSAVELWASPARLQRALATPLRRCGGLDQRLAAALVAGR